MTDAARVGPDHLHRVPMYTSANRPCRRWKTTPSRPAANMPLSTRHFRSAGRAPPSLSLIGLGLSGARTAGRSASPTWPPKSPWARSASSCAWRYRGSPATMPTGIDICAFTRTLIADTDGLYHPGDFNDRLVLGLRGTMSEAELHILRARLDGGIRLKAARGELRRGLPTGFVWGDADGEILFYPDARLPVAVLVLASRKSMPLPWSGLCSPHGSLQATYMYAHIRIPPTYVSGDLISISPVKPCRRRRHFCPRMRTNRFVFLNLPALQPREPSRRNGFASIPFTCGLRHPAS